MERALRGNRPPGEGRLLQLAYYGYVALSRVALALPESWAYGIAHVAGGIAARRSRRRALVAANLARITGHPRDSEDVQRLVVYAYRSYARYWLETFRLVREGRHFWLERMQSATDYRIDEALARGKGVVIVVGHLGNWDAAGAWVGARGNKLVTVAEVLRPRRLFEFFLGHRAKLGMTIYAAQAGVTSDLVREAEGGAVVAILGDRDLKGTGLELDFFGEPATFPAGAASVALRAGVPLLVAGVFERRLPGGERGWYVDFSEPIELPAEREGAVADLTEQVVAKLEEFVARHPEQWHVFQPFWIADRKPART